jgi:cell division protein FtsB
MKKISFIIIVITLILIINNLVSSIWDIWQKKDVVSQAQGELSRQKQENQRLKSALSYAKTSEFIEKEARNKLFMVKDGEQKVLLPQDSGNLQELSKESNDPNWKKWWNLFFN